MRNRVKERFFEKEITPDKLFLEFFRRRYAGAYSRAFRVFALPRSCQP
jgi:hypothetical protein